MIQQTNKTIFSFEIFPPKKTMSIDTVYNALDELKDLKPDFISVTYGAGGGTSQYTTKIASLIKNRLDTTALAHLTCASTPKDKIDSILNTLKENHIDNILAMRGFPTTRWLVNNPKKEVISYSAFGVRNATSSI